MKKKFTLLLAIVLVIVTCCIALVGCGEEDKENGKENVIYNTPAQFAEAWLKSPSKAFTKPYVTGAGNITYGADGDKWCEVCDYVPTKTYFEIVGDNVYMYSYFINGDGSWGWSAFVDKKDENSDDKFKGFPEFLNNMVKDDIIITITDEIFKNNFALQNGWYVGSGDFSDYKFKISGKELEFVDSVNNRNNKKYVIDYKITIPQEAKDALQDKQSKA